MQDNTPRPQKILIILAIIVLAGYAIFNSRFILKGPEIAIAGLEEDGEIIKTDSKSFSLQGIALHSSYITLNNRPILVDESGNFNEKLLLSNGISIIDLYARDKFGKEVRKKIDVVYTGTDEFISKEVGQVALHALTASSTPEEIKKDDVDETETQEEMNDEE